MDLILNWPPSVNHYWRSYRGRVLISAEGRDYRDAVCAALGDDRGGGPRKPPTGGRIALAIDAYPPDRRRRDLDNICKALLDALAHAGVYRDDEQIDVLLVRRRECIPGGRVEVRVLELPTVRCIACGCGNWSAN